MASHAYADVMGQYDRGLLADGHSEEAKHLRNVFACEAHNELMKNTMLMAYESRMEAARPGVALIEKLRNMEGFEV